MLQLGMIGPWQVLILVFFMLFLGLLPLLALISILRNEFTSNNKLIWVILVIFLPILGPLLYLILGSKYKISATPKA